ncbi:MAG TPA: radical SAM protein, partial [Methanothrix sp.]
MILSFDGFPLIIGWELTLACNLRCKHCGSSAGQPRPGELTREEALKLCDQFPALLVQEVDFTGGEPLLRSDWAEIAEHLRDLGIKTEILSNGIALEPEVISKMKEVGISGVGISLDGLEQTHDLIRAQKGSFQHVLAGIKRVLEAGIPLTIITTVNALNIDQLPEIGELLKSLGVERWRLQPIVPFGRVKGSTELVLNEQTYLQLEEFANSWRALEGEMELICTDGLNYFNEINRPDYPWRGCPAGLGTCSITSDGKVKGCLSLPDEIIEGDLRKNDLWDIWFDPKS